jgi:hypothetical protein
MSPLGSSFVDAHFDYVCDALPLGSPRRFVPCPSGRGAHLRHRRQRERSIYRAEIRAEAAL